jgi:hypothetical protein
MLSVPKRRETLLGLQAYKGEQSEAKVEQALRDLIPITYPVTLKNKRGIIVSGHVTTYLELFDWIEWKNYTLVSMDGDPDMALDSDRTTLL